jgi:hypothetical protein
MQGGDYRRQYRTITNIIDNFNKGYYGLSPRTCVD